MKPNNFLLLISGLFLITSGISAQKTALLYAEELLEKDQLDSAVFYFESALGQNPNNTELKLKLADLYRISNRASKANILYEQLTKSPNADFKTWLNYAYTLNMDGKYDQSRSLFMQLKSHPDVVGNGSLIQLIEYKISASDFAVENKAKISAFARIANEKAVNSTASEFSLYLSGNQVYYASNKSVSNIYGNPNANTDPNSDFIYVANRKNYKELTEVKLLHDINNENFSAEAADLAPFCFSIDTKFLLSSSNSMPAGLRQGFNSNNGRLFQLNYAELSSVNEIPKLKRIEFANSAANVEAGFPFLSKDGKSLYFASKGNGLEINYGGYDIYVSYNESGVWSSPKNLGATVNGPGNELSPFIDDYGTLYFASDGHKGFGGYDIFRAEKNAESWQDLRNLGYGINSSGDELYFIFDFAHDLAYFCSNRLGGAGDLDIYSAIKLGDLSMMPRVNDDLIIQPLAATTKPIEKLAVIKDEQNKNDNRSELAKNNGKVSNMPVPVSTTPVVENKKIEETIASTGNNKVKTETSSLNKLPCADNVYIGAISDASTKDRLDGVWVYIKNKKTGDERKIKSSKYGEYSVILDEMTTYEVKYSKQGYENYSFEISTGDGERRTLLSERDMARAATNAMPEEMMRENGLAARGSSAPTASNETFLRGPQTGKEVPQTGFQIQVGVFKDINPTTQKVLATLANIITEPYKDGQAKIYRLGVFADETHAKDVLSKVQTVVGLEKSFIKKIDLKQKSTSDRMNSDLMLVYPKVSAAKAVEKKEVDSKVVEIKKTEQLKAQEDKKQVQVKETDKKIEPKVENTGSEIKIQIGAYKDPAKAQLPELKDLGELEKVFVKETGLTVFYLKGYKNVEAARTAVKKAEEKGVVKPFIVAFKNGKKVDLKEIEK